MCQYLTGNTIVPHHTLKARSPSDTTAERLPTYSGKMELPLKYIIERKKLKMEHTEYFLTPDKYTANMTQIGWYYWSEGRFPVFYESPEYRAQLDTYEARRGPYRGPGMRDIDAECDAVQLKRELEGKE